jgi:hypothetical protein
MENHERKMLSPYEVSRIYSISEGSLANWRFLNRGPKFYRVARKILYSVEDCENFFKGNLVLTKDDPS